MHRTSVTSALLLCLAASVATTPASAAASQISFTSTAPIGSIVINTSERRLYLIVAHGKALQYKVGVGRAGRQWEGVSSISAKFIEPAWAPPDDVRHDKPNLPAVIPGGTAANPMGAAAMTLTGGPYAIHGTNAPDSIGGFVSYGCIRMYNADIIDLYSRVRVGTAVVVRP